MKMLKRLACVALCICAVVMCACSSDKCIAVLEVDGKQTETFDKQFTSFWISYQKRAYADVAAQYEDGWEHIVDPKTQMTVYDLLMSQVEESIRNFTAIVYLHDEKYALELTDEQISTSDKLVRQIIASDEEAEKLEECSADEETLKQFYRLMLKQTNLYNHMYGQDGEYAITEEQKKEYFKNSYAVADHIFFAFDTTDENGEVLSNDRFMILANQTRKAASDVFNAIKEGQADFDETKQQYNEDKSGEQQFPYGFFITNDSFFPAQFTSKVMEMPVGEISLVETPGKGVHIVRRLDMDETLYNAYPSVTDSIESTLRSEDMKKRVSDIAERVVVDNAALKKFDPEFIPEFPYRLL